MSYLLWTRLSERLRWADSAEMQSSTWNTQRSLVSVDRATR